MTTVTAVYERGVLRPTEPLDLAEGERVELTIRSPDPLSEEEIIRRIKAAKTYRELFEVTKLLPPDDGDWDIEKALEANRRWSNGEAES